MDLGGVFYRAQENPAFDLINNVPTPTYYALISFFFVNAQVNFSIPVRKLSKLRRGS